MQARNAEITDFLGRAGWSAARREALAGDASSRRYERLYLGARQAILMDAPVLGNDPARADEAAYIRKAALAAGLAPFVAVGDWLRGLGLGAPEIYACDICLGLMLLEDLGDLNFGRMLDDGHADLEAAYTEAVDALVTLHRAGAPQELAVRGSATHHPPAYTMDIMRNELAMLFDWYAPEHRAAPLTAPQIDAFWAAWEPLLATPAQGLAPVVVLRDYHSPNLHWRPGRLGADRLGIIDFQDALIGSPAHDLMSLLQDGRKDLPDGFEARFMAYYLAARQSDAGFEVAAFRRSYAILGAVRNIRLLGLWVRLPKRDGKKHYARHLPRAWRHVAANLAHPALAGVADWMDRVFPPRSRPGQAPP